jgi:hypothetical protein
MTLSALRASFLIFCLASFTTAFGQLVQQPASQGDILLNYTRELGLNARLYNGPEYEDYSNTVKIGFPYFVSKDYQPGSVIFDSILYPGIQVRFDIVKDLLMVLHPISYVSMQLRSETIGGFTIGSHQFVHLGVDSAEGMKNAFYERLYDGKTPVYVRHRKDLQDRNKSDDIYREAVPYDSYFILKDNQYHQVRSSKGLFAIFKGREKVIQQHLRKQKLRFKRNKELAIVEAAKFYDQLTN